MAADLQGMRPADAAEALLEVDPGDRSSALSALPAERAGRVLAELEREALRETLAETGAERIAAILSTMASDDRVEALRALEGEPRERVLARLDPAVRARMEQLLAHPADAAGGIMSLEIPTVRVDATVGEACDRLREEPPEDENTAALFVVDERGALVGRVALVRLLASPREVRIEDVMDREVVSIPADTDQEEAAAIAARYDLPALPVVGDRGELLGVLTFDDLFDVIEEEEAEDLAYFAGTGTDETPRDRGVARAVRGRLPWLVLGLATGIANVFVMGRFEGALERLVSVAFFIPVVLGLSGAVAVQSSSLVVRGLAGGGAALRLPRIASRELQVSLILGPVLGVVLASTGYALTGGHVRLALALLGALVLVVSVAAMSGALIPLTLERLGFDPAVAMGPFLTAANDVVALAIYLTVASALLA